MELKNRKLKKAYQRQGDRVDWDKYNNSSIGNPVNERKLWKTNLNKAYKIIEEYNDEWSPDEIMEPNYHRYRQIRKNNSETSKISKEELHTKIKEWKSKKSIKKVK